MTNLRILLFLLLFSLFGKQVGQAQTKSLIKETTAKPRLEAYLDTLEKVGFSGSVLIELNGKKIISAGYGYSHLAQKRKNTPQTLFDIGSITKQFTAAAILKLESQGKLSTNDKISSYFKNVPADKSDITLHDLLRHQSGLPSNVGGDYDPISESAFIDSVLHAPLEFKTGTRFSYSNIGYSLLAIIVEKVSGLSYEQFLYTQLWKPAGMEFTGYSRPAFDTSLIATGYHKDDTAWGKPTDKAWAGDAPYGHLKGNGGILSTTEDLCKWNAALLSDAILPPAAKEKYYHPKLRADETDSPYYAYGWDVRKTARNTWLVQHNGSNRIFLADFSRYIDEGITIITMSNKSQAGFFDLNRELAAILFDSLYVPPIPVADNPQNRAFTAKIISIILEQGSAAGLTEYAKRGNAVQVLEDEVNRKGYDLLGKNNFMQAIAIFNLNVVAYPASANTYDSLGEAYLAAGNKKLAIENYKKSVVLNPENTNAVEVLKKITAP